MKKLISRSFYGMFFGGFLAVLFTNLTVLFGASEIIDGPLFLKNSIGSILCGWLFTVSPMYFENRNLKLYQQTLLHFFTVIPLYLILALVIGWIPFNRINILITIFVAIIVYTMFWLAFYLYFKSQARKFNEQLRNL